MVSSPKLLIKKGKKNNMKRLVTIALLCAMLLSCFVGCGSMQAGELDVDAYAADASAQDVAFRTELSTNADEVDVWDGTADTSWYDAANPKTSYEISTAEQLRGIYTLQQALANNTSIFDGVTFTLTKDFDLAGKQWSAAASTRYFAGTIDGQGHVIANYWDAVTGSGYKSFFGSVSDNACIKNLSLVNGKLYNRLKGDANKDVYGAIVTRANTVSGKKITISNIYVDVDVVEDNPTKLFSKASGAVGMIQGAGDILIENVTYVGDIKLNSGYVAGICALVSKAKNVTVKNCVVTGNLTSVGSRNGGIFGYVETLTGALSVSGCTVSGSISGTSGTAGIIGVTNVTKNITIKDCTVSADITGTTQTAGVLGQLAVGRDEKYTDATTGEEKTRKVGGAGEVVVSGCTVSGDITANTMSGGVIGYCDRKITSLAISDCKVNGSFTGHRTSGGIMGTLNISTAKATIKDCEVTATLNLYADDKKNNNVGGLIGKVHSNTDIENCYVAPIMTATYAPAAGYAATDDLVSGAGGLIGRVYSGVTVYLANCEVGGSLTFVHEGNDDEFLFNVGHFVGSVGEEVLNAETGEVKTVAAKVIFRENNTISTGTVFNCDGVDFNENDVGTHPVILPVGYQTKDNDDGSYDLRFVFAMEANAFQAVGVKADLGFVYGEEATFGQKVETVYAKTVYKTITDENGYVYKASDYGYGYLYTLVVTGVPAEYSFDAETLQAILTPFGANKVDGEVITQNGAIMLVGDKALANNVAMGGFGVGDLSPELDTEKYDETAIYVDANDFDTDLSWGVHTGVKASAAECDGDYKEGTLPIPTHVYLDNGIVVGDARLMNITYTFEIAEAGYYDMCIYFRLKGSGTNGDGSYNRGYLLSFDGAYGEEAIDFSVVEETSVADVKDASAGTYLDLGNETYFEAGTHTVTFSVGATGSFPHLRGLYFVKVAD